MRRDFSSEPVSREIVDSLLETALTAPTAGNTQGVEWLLIETADARRRFFEAATDGGFLDDPGELAGLLRAPVIAVPFADPASYVDRYSEPDKRSSGLAGLEASQWPVPYWTVDAGFGAMLFLLAAEAQGLGAAFFRLHRPAGDVLAAFGLPPDATVIGAVALGWPAPGSSGPLGSARRSKRPFAERVHRPA